MTADTDGATFARRPTPTTPDGVEVGERLGQYGGTVSRYTRSLLDQAATLLPGRSITRQWSTVEKMRRHWQVSACLRVQRIAEQRADWSIECDDDDIREWLEEAYRAIAFDVQRTSARATWAGYSPNTLTWDYDPDLGGLVITEIRDLEPRTCDAAVDGAGSYVGLVQKIAGAPDLPVDELATLWVVEDMESGNLYGRSVLEAAYDPWADLATIRAFHARYLERFGEPVVKMRVPTGSSIANAQEIADAVAKGEAPPAPVMVDNVTEGRLIGENLRHHSVISFPSTPHVGPKGDVVGYQWDAEYLEASRQGGTDFLDARKEGAKEIARAIFVPDLLLDNSETGAYATSKTHADIWVQGTEGRLDDRSRQQTAQLVDRLRWVNFGERSPKARLVYAPQVDETAELLREIVVQLITDGKLDADGEAMATRVGVPILTSSEPDGGPPVSTSEDDPAMSRERIEVTLAAKPDVTGLPEWKLPQAWDPPATARREPTARERRVAFRRIEDGLNRIEAQTIARLVELLERERERVARQVRGALAKGSEAEILAALGTIEVKGGADVARAWADLMGEVWGLGLETLRDELAAYASQIPTTTGAAGTALIRAYAASASERVMSQLATEVRFELLNAYTSEVSPAGMASVVSDVFDAYEGSEGRAPRLTSRMLSSKALNTARKDALERGGVPLKGAQYSALLDRRVCDLCERLDETVIPVTHTDLARFTPPVHHNCRCVWVWITVDEADFTPTWSTPPPSLVERFGGLVF